MDSTQAEECLPLYIIRFWAEDLGDGMSEWRGRVQRLPDGETLYFRDWPALVAFLRMGLPNPGSSAAEDGAGP